MVVGMDLMSLKEQKDLVDAPYAVPASLVAATSRRIVVSGTGNLAHLIRDMYAAQELIRSVNSKVSDPIAARLAFDIECAKDEGSGRPVAHHSVGVGTRGGEVAPDEAVTRAQRWADDHRVLSRELDKRLRALASIPEECETYRVFIESGGLMGWKIRRTTESTMV
ncbi:hypothetical protein SEA_EVAA_59 [Gordonia phage Evaa]|nr:hypothetical protein SEA_EVAA_59 [Gordonia phage Evaa]